jgi:hypothetical protein
MEGWEGGRSGAGAPSGHSPKGGAAKASPAKPSVPNAAWRFDALPFDQRPMRQFVWLSGERSHSGMRWRRDHWGLAYIRPDGLGYREEDIAQIEREGDMDAGTGEVYGWLPACTPAYFDMERHEAIEVNAPGEGTDRYRKAAELARESAQ